MYYKLLNFSGDKNFVFKTILEVKLFDEVKPRGVRKWFGVVFVDH